MIINSFLGIRNTNPIRSIPDNALTAALDIDINNVGTLIQRNGFVLSKSISNVTSAYTTLDNVSYIVQNGLLNRVDDDLNLIPLAACTATSFCDSGKVLFTNDGLKIQDDKVIDLNIPASDFDAPELYAAPGNWMPGTYNALYTYRNAAGMEGHTSPNSYLTITAGQCVVVDPPPAIANHTAIIYLTEANGTVYYNLDGEILNPFQTINNSYPLDATVIAWYASSLYAATPQANGTTLLAWSLPFLPHLYDTMTNYIVVPGEIRAMMDTSDFLIIATDAFIYSWDGAALNRLANYGVPAGRPLMRVPTKTADNTSSATVKLFTYRGVCEAMPFVNLTETKALFPAGQQTSVALINQNGIQKFIALSDGSGVAYNVK